MGNSWTYCDGRGGLGTSRRSVLKGGAAALGVACLSPALSKLLIDSEAGESHVLVVVFLRGGADGLNMVVPVFEDAYYRARPALGMTERETLALDGKFRLHPSLSPLLDAWDSGQLAIVHAIGSQDKTRSHFEAMSAVERGVESPSEGLSSGWLARTLLSQPKKHPSPLRAVAVSPTLPDSLRGGGPIANVVSIDEYRLNADVSFARSLRDAYRNGMDEVAIAGRETLSVLDTLSKLDLSTNLPQNGAVYPDTEFGAALRQVALLIRAGVGLEYACVDKGGWDTHVVQGKGSGWHASLLDDTAKSIGAFRRDLGKGFDRVSVCVMTEFGRRLHENAGLGTDHGRAGTLFVLDREVTAKSVIGEWPGLEPKNLDDGDLRVTTDYRSVLGELLSKRMGIRDVASVFPGLQAPSLGLLGHG